MTPARRTALGLSLVASGWLMAGIAGLVGWSAGQRWFAANETRAAAQRFQAGKSTEARKLAAVAAGRLPAEPAPVLLATDLAHEGAADRLLALVPSLDDPRDRRSVLAAVALSRVLRGKPPDIDLEGTGDGRLIAALNAVRTGTTPGRLASEAEEPPHLAVQRAALTVLLRNAWTHGDAEAVRRYGGALLLLAPQQPEAAVIAVAVLAATVEATDEAVLARLGEVTDQQRAPLVRAVAALAPARRPALDRRFPGLVEAKP